MFSLDRKHLLTGALSQSGSHMDQSTLFHGTKNCKTNYRSFTWTGNKFEVGRVLERYVLRRMEAP